MGWMRVCADPSCPELVGGGRHYCPAHEQQRREAQAARLRIVDRDIKARSTWRWVYKSRRWQGLRRQVLAEQPWCAAAECHELSHDVDHIVALQDGGAPFDRENAQGLCVRHHSMKTADEVRARKKR